MVQAVRLLAFVCVGGGGGKRFEDCRTLTILTDVFHSFYQPFQANVGIKS